MNLPLIHTIAYQDPWLLFSHFADKPGSIFLDSAQQKENCGRYSFIVIDPFITLESKDGIIKKNNEILKGNPFDILNAELKKYSQETLPDLPPFQGGAAGYFGYELFQHCEKIPFAAKDDLQFPDMMLGFYDLVISFDAVEKKAWIVSTGFPYLKKTDRESHAKNRLEKILEKISDPHSTFCSNIYCKKEDITSHFTKEKYSTTVKKVIDYILAGDIFEANLSQRFITELPKKLSAIELYHRLRQSTPATFSAYLNFSDVKLLSASPERFMKLENGLVETRPIKGTRKRGKTTEEDQTFARDLLNSEKDRAENIMIVDLLRNDLSRVCEDHCVKVTQLCGLESYAAVHHLVSVIQGKLLPELNAIDLIRASYPGGSITGAPKIRAMEIISELEPTYRGPYCGSIGYIGFDGNMDSSITIRTFCIKDNIITFQAGGAIVADSDPVQEYEETLTKANALFKVLTGESM